MALKRSQIQRGSEMNRGSTPLKRTRLNPRSKKREQYMVGRRKRVAEAVGDGWQPCKIQADGCTGNVQGIHEVLSRGRAGGLEAAERDGETINCCNACNGYVSEHPIEALAKGLLVHARNDEERWG